MCTILIEALMPLNRTSCIKMYKNNARSRLFRRIAKRSIVAIDTWHSRTLSYFVRDSKMEVKLFLTDPKQGGLLWNGVSGKVSCFYGFHYFIVLKGVQRPAAFAIVGFVFVNFVQSDILEAVESKSLTSRKTCWSNALAFVVHL